MTDVRHYRRQMFSVRNDEELHSWECANCDFSVSATASDIQSGFRFACPECGGNVTGWPEKCEPQSND